MYAIFFTNHGIAIQIASRRRKSVNATCYNRKVLLKLRNISKTNDQQLVSVVSGCCMTMVRQTKRPLYENV
jgi:hypothetical protein